MEDLLREDVKLRVSESVQTDQWVQLLHECKDTAPRLKGQAEILVKELQKIAEMKERLESKKYKLFACLI